MNSTEAAAARIAEVAEQRRQRQAREELAQNAFRGALSRCHEIAKTLLERTDVKVQLDDDKLVLEAVHGARAEFTFDRGQIAMVGTRFYGPGSVRQSEAFFSWRIAPPPKPLGNDPNRWGPSKVPAQPMPDSQAAFEKAVADWFEWAHIGTGLGGIENGTHR